jgi:adenosine deaminase
MRRIALTLLTALCLVPAGSALASEDGAARYLASVRHDPVALRAFLWDMPKGGDLHNHLSGAVYAESFVKWGAQTGACVDAGYTARPGPCTDGLRPIADALTDNVLYNNVLKAWSMKGFRDGVESGHDHFFATFDRFSAAGSGRTGDMLAEVASRAAAQNEQYLETLITPRFGDTMRVLNSVTPTDDLAVMRQRLLDAGLRGVVPLIQADTDAWFARQRELLGCATATPDPACDMPVRLQFQGLRGQPLPFVFTQMVLAFELMKADPRWVAFNLVQPEDGPVSLADYERQMQMLQFLRPLYPGEHVTLHAGELVAGLAPPADLRFHIRDAVVVAGAERIGHGVDITLERDPPSLLRTMARRHVLVESPLVSNCQILEVCGRRHPIRLYVRSGVPVALATDDEGVSRSDMTDQYEQAAVAQGFGYRALKRFAQDSLRYSFLSDGDKALALRTQRAAFARFEARFPTR